MKALKIGKIKLKSPVILAPMVDVTDSAYRQVCKKAGASLVYTEMLYVDAITHENPKTQHLMKFVEKERPIGIQITGNNLEEFEKAVPYLKKYDLVDINCGCPSIRIVGSKGGSYLLKEPDKISSIIKLLKKHKMTVTAKIRLGFDTNEGVKIAKMVEKAGADAITVHARLANQSYSVKAQWEEIDKIKKSLKIPVIGNGDVLDEESAKELLQHCDGVMVARGAIGDPLVFKRIDNYLKTGKKTKQNPNKTIKMLQEYIKLTKKEDIIDIQRIKYVASNFLRGFDGAKLLRVELMGLKTIDDIEMFVKSIKI